MKTTNEIFLQQMRVDKLLWEVTSKLINKVHPQTGGSLHLAHNWGNDEAKKHLDRHKDRQIFLNSLFGSHYKRAFIRQYPNHILSKNILTPKISTNGLR